MFQPAAVPPVLRRTLSMFTTNASRGLPRHRSRYPTERYTRWAMRALIGLIVLAALWLVLAFHLNGQPIFALLFLVLGAALGVVFTRRRLMSHRYIFPAVASMGLFVIFPLLYTIGISFSNYSSSNLLSEERVRAQLLSRTYQEESATFGFQIHMTEEGARLYLEREGSPAADMDEGETEAEAALRGVTRFSTGPITLAGDARRHVQIYPAEAEPAGEPLPMREVIAHRGALQNLVLVTPEGLELRMAGLRHYAPMLDRYETRDDGSLYDRRDDRVLTPDYESGFFFADDGERITPGWPVSVGFDNYARIFFDPDIRGPFLQIFVWTFAFAGLTVVFTLIVGFVLAALLQWDQMRGKAVYRTLLILPYAVPAFISILIFKGMFNQHFGEINLILDALFGIRPDWFTDPWLARSMLLIVNTWLGYPYMLLLCMGLIQSIPRDLYEASAVDGGGPLTNLFRITLPLIIKPLTPLLIACFAFNFNNFVLIALLTGGNPDILGASTPAGTTDLLVSYTYRIAFQDAGQNFGLAAAIATLIFLLVAGLALLNLRLAKVRV
jgi:maltose/maltodextrin transport system permease protein